MASRPFWSRRIRRFPPCCAPTAGGSVSSRARSKTSGCADESIEEANVRARRLLAALGVTVWITVLVVSFDASLGSPGHEVPRGADLVNRLMGATLLRRDPALLYDLPTQHAVEQELIAGCCPTFDEPFLAPPFVAAAYVPLTLLPPLATQLV